MMGKSLKLIENSHSVSLARIKFDGFSSSNRWIGYVESKNLDTNGKETSCALFEKFFAGYEQDFFLLSALAYNDKRGSRLYKRYLNVYKLAKRIGFLAPITEDFISYYFEDIPFQYEFLSLTFDDALYMPLSKLMMEMVFGCVVSQTFFLINPKLQIAVYPHDDASFGIIALNEDPTIGVEFLKFCEQDPQFQVHFDDGVLEDYERRKAQSSEATQWNFPKEWHRSPSFFNDRQTHRRKEMELIKEKIKKNTLIKCIPLKRICFNDLRQSQCWVGSFSAKHQDVKEIENAMQLMQDFFASKTDDFFVLSALAYEDKTSQVSVDEEVLDRYEQAKQTGFLQALTDEFLSWIQGKSQFLYQFINFTFNAEYYVPFVKMMMYLKPHQLVVGDLCVLISPKLQIALYPHDDIGFGVIALDDNPTLGVEFLRFCEKDERFSAHIDADALKDSKKV
ncbi:hypothetical protein [Pelistega suis]|uniref:Uncharacterized protein n=1 Tax=Pelistega suis TaxID=1631957 RepID=A0A849PA29_9BURK|nr:hypothetical protein [Pelistega suis]NOL52582.1 hypothetical protein [Pelistega suis]